MESNLFIELSEEQQEVVAGGADVALSKTSFFNLAKSFGTTSSSGPNGSTGSTYGSLNVTKTGGLQFIGFGV